MWYYIVSIPDLYSYLLFFLNCIVGIPMGTDCALLVAELFLFCYERDFMLSLSDNY